MDYKVGDIVRVNEKYGVWDSQELVGSVVEVTLVNEDEVFARILFGPYHTETNLMLYDHELDPIKQE